MSRRLDPDCFSLAALRRAAWLGVLALGLALGCREESIPRELLVFQPPAPSDATYAGTEPRRDVDALTESLESPDRMVRYSAAARAFEAVTPSEVSASARQALFQLVANPREPGGVRLWAARAVAKLEPATAIERFIELSALGTPVDDDAWLILGPRALPHLTSRCSVANCPTHTLLKLSLIVSAAPDTPESRAAIPLLLRESTRSEEHKAIVYRSLGSFGASLRSELQALETHKEPTVRKAAASALESIQ